MSASHCTAKRSRTIEQHRPVATPWLRAAAGVLAGLAVFALGGAAQAQPDIFTVAGVEVDAQARTANQARSQALEAGQRRALTQLFRRLVPQSYYDQLPALSSADAIDLVRDFSVANERTSSTRYLAELTVRFRPDAVRSTLRFANVPFSETVSKPVVIVPVYRASIVADPILWQDPNPWRDAWYGVEEASGLVPRQLPYGDLEDLTALRATDAEARDRDRLKQWAARYGADDAVVATAFLNGGIGSESVAVSLYFTRSGEERRLEVPATGGQTWADLFRAAAALAWADVEDEWKQQNMLQFGVTGQITALVPLARLEDWVFVRSRLQDVPLVDRYELQAITRDRAQVTVYYLGDEPQLRLAMAQLDLALVRQDDVWMIERRDRDEGDRVVLRGQPGAQAPIPNAVVPAEQNAAPPPVYPSGLFQPSQAGPGAR